MLGTGDEVVLQILGQFREVSAVARDADDEAAVLFRILLGIDQGLAVDHVELHMPQPQVHEGANEAHQLAGTFLAGQAAGGELDVQQAGGTLEVSLLYGDGKSQAEHPDGADYYTHSTMAGVYPAGAQRSGCISDRPDRHPADLYGQERRQPDRRL